MTDTLKALLQELRQHHAFSELLEAVEVPRFPRWRKGDAARDFGEQAIHAQGAQEQHERWLALLTGPAKE